MDNLNYIKGKRHKDGDVRSIIDEIALANKLQNPLEGKVY